MANMGLVHAAREIQSFGRGPDKMLAHIAPDEAAFVDYLQGGRRTNPHTGLPEYGLFGKILKTVARVAGAVGGFMVGGPLGAAAGSAAATKLTGGSWKQALKAGAMSGVGSFATQGLTGGGWGLTGAVPGAAAGAGAGSAVGAGASSIGAGVSPSLSAAAAGLPTGATAGLAASLASAGGASGLVGASPGFFSGLAGAAPAVSSGGLSAVLSSVGGYPGAVAGLGALTNPLTPEDNSEPTPQMGDNINLNVEPLNRVYNPYTGDPTKFGEQAGGWKFFDEVNPKPKFLARGGRVGLAAYADGGRAAQDSQWAQMLPHWPAEAMSQIQGGGSGYPSMSPDDAFAVGGMTGTVGKFDLSGGTRARTAENVDRQGGPLASKVGIDRLIKILEDHGMEWTYPPSGNGITAYTEVVGPGGKVFKEGKHFNEKTSLKTLRDWLGYSKGGAVHAYAFGGPVGPQGPGAGLSGLGGLRTPGIPSQIETPHFSDAAYTRAQSQDMSPASQRQRLRQAAILGYTNAAQGGSIHGPGDGKSDDIPAMLSNNEHVIDAATVADAGNGDSEAGHEKIEQIKAEIRRRAGRRHPRKPTPKQRGSAESLVSKVM